MKPKYNIKSNINSIKPILDKLYIIYKIERKANRFRCPSP